MTFHRPRGAGLGLAAAALLAVACQTTLTLDSDNLQTEIASGFQEQTGIAVTVSCPDDRPLQQGDTFTCTAAAADGQSYTIQVTQTDAAGNVNWQVVQG
jgi:hypothetical protein